MSMFLCLLATCVSFINPLIPLAHLSFWKSFVNGFYVFQVLCYRYLPSFRYPLKSHGVFQHLDASLPMQLQNLANILVMCLMPMQALSAHRHCFLSTTGPDEGHYSVFLAQPPAPVPPMPLVISSGENVLFSGSLQYPIPAEGTRKSFTEFSLSLSMQAWFSALNLHKLQI